MIGDELNEQEVFFLWHGGMNVELTGAFPGVMKVSVERLYQMFKQRMQEEAAQEKPE